MPFTKTDLLKNLRRIQKALCAYQSSRFCDCKFMKDSDADSTICSLHENGSGCPEVREAIDLIEKIPDWDAHAQEEKPKSSRRLYSLAGNNCCFECNSCSSKGGWPELCTDCIRRRGICQTKHKARK